MKGTVNPVWDETLELSVPDYASPVYLEVWDHDKIGTNDSLGTGEILLGQCEPGVPTLLTVAIDTQGTVEVEVTWLPAERQQHGYAPAVTVDTSPMSVRRGLPSSLTQSQSAVELSPASRKANGHDETQMGVATVRVLRGSKSQSELTLSNVPSNSRPTSSARALSVAEPLLPPVLSRSERKFTGTLPMLSSA